MQIHPLPTKPASTDDTIPLPHAELMLYPDSAGDKSIPSTRFPAFTAAIVSNQVANGLCGRLPPTVLIGVVAPATGPATARHPSGIVPRGMDNESKKTIAQTLRP